MEGNWRLVWEKWLSLIIASSMLSVLIQNMGLLCSRNRHYNEADAEENAQVSNILDCGNKYSFGSFTCCHFHYTAFVFVCMSDNFMILISLYFLNFMWYYFLITLLPYAFPGCRNWKADWTRDKGRKAYPETPVAWYVYINWILILLLKCMLLITLEVWASWV